MAAYRHLHGKRGDVAKAAIEALESRVLFSGVTFASARTFDAGSGISSVAVGDFNGDGKSDLAGANYFDSTVSVLLGDGDGAFAYKRDYSVGSSPYSVTVGDFNGDGKTDLATVCVWASEMEPMGTVSILLGNGDGTFMEVRDYSVGRSPESLAVGDFNGDGKSDLAVANFSDGTVSILLGNGDGSFAGRSDYSTGSFPQWVTVGDFNGDGTIDLAAANYISNTVSILLGNGDGTFADKSDYSAGNHPESLAGGDFNGDGKSDLATANNMSNTVSILLGNGDGSFASKSDYSTDRFPLSVTVGDFNGDGNSDLATANYDGNTVSVLLGNGDGSFAGKSDYRAGSIPRCVTVGDFNGDGTSDLAVANWGGDTVSVLLGNGDGAFTVKGNYSVGSFPLSVAVGDFNGDGNSDLATANNVSSTVSILLGYGNGTFMDVRDYSVGSGPNCVAVGDFDGNGKSDLAVSNHGVYPDSNGMVSILLGRGDGTFTRKSDHVVGEQPQFVTVGDFNGDGKSDLAVANQGMYPDFSGTVSILLGNGDGTFAGKSDCGIRLSPYSVAVGDFNGDGKNDLATANSWSYEMVSVGTVSILLGHGDGTFADESEHSVGSSLSSVTVGDFNGDGEMDLATAGNSSDTVSILLGNGDGSFMEARDYSVGSCPLAVAVGDFNGDGRSDLATANDGSNTVSVLLGNYDGTFTDRSDYSVGNGPCSVTVGDFNGDGKDDLATANNRSVSVNVLLNTTIFSCPTHISLSARGVLEKQPVGTFVGVLSTTDPDAGDTFTYSLVSGAGSDGNSMLTISGDQLVTAAVFDHDVKNIYSIRIRTTDETGNYLERVFSIQVAAESGMFGTKHPLILCDADGDAVKITIRGGGEGMLLPDDTIALNGTTAKTVLTIAVRRGATGDGMLHLSGITSDGLLKAIDAGAVVISGQVYLNTLDQAPGKARVSLKFRQISEADVRVQGMPVGAIVVGGAVTDSRIVTTGSIGKLRAAALLDSDILVGVDASFAGQFAESGDFVNSTARLVSLKVTGEKLFRGSSYPAYVSGVHVSAPSVGVLKLANVSDAVGAIQVNVVRDIGTLTITERNPVMEGVSVLEAGVWEPGTAGRPGIFSVV